MRKVDRAISCLIVAVAAFGARAEQSDDWLSVSDDTAVVRTFGSRHILIFTNTASAATVTLKRAMTLDEYLIVGGGGGGGNSGNVFSGGGGGGGGVVHANAPQSVAAAAELTVTVGAGGATTTSNFMAGKQGGHSSLAFGGQTIYGYGGSGGAGYSESVLPAAKEGEVGSGGGGTRATYGLIGTEGLQWNTTQGNKGFQAGGGIGGGGGGAGSAGNFDFGGEGLEFAISGEPVVYGSGGGGGGQLNDTSKGGQGGTNGGHGTVSATVRATPGRDGTGGGGGGAGYQDAVGSRGGSGTVILVLSEAVETVSRFAVQPIEDQLLVEAAASPEVVVKDAESGEVLPASAYTVTYANNESAGHAVAVVQGAANTGYEGYTAIGSFAVHAVAYEDENLVASDASVSNVVIGDRHVYIFTNVSEKIVFRTKRMLTRDRMLLVGGGGSGGGYYGGGGGGYVAEDKPALVEDPIEGVLKIGAGAPAHGSTTSAYAPGCQGGHTWLNFGGKTVFAYGGGGAAGNGYSTPKAAVENEIGSGGGGGVTSENGFYWNKAQGHPCGAPPGGSACGGGGGAGFAGVYSTGGEGVTNDITGVAVVYGSGGGGYPTKSGESKGGTNAGSAYYINDNVVSGSGVDGTGAGGGGGSAFAYGSGGNGGSGIAVLSFLVGDHVHYRDEFILTDDLTVRRIDKSDSVVYVFTNTVATQVVQVLKQMRIKRALLVGGGGAGGALIGGGGGGGGVTNVSVRQVFDAKSEFFVCVGAGGQGHKGGMGDQGGRSSLSAEGLSLIAYGGGGGAYYAKSPSAAAVYGEIGSGGGGSNGGAGSLGTQWYYGHSGSGGNNNFGGGGGGMLTAGSGISGDYAGNGGEGVTNSITGAAVVYGSGGGGGVRLQGGGQARVPGEGGTNAGKGGKEGTGYPGLDGTGAGGGGGGYDDAFTQFAGGNGGCGTVILEVTPVRGLVLILR